MNYFYAKGLQLRIHGKSACLSLRRVCVLHLPVVYEGTLRDHVITRIRLTAAFDADPFCHLSDCLHAGSSCPDRCVLAAVTSEVVRWPPHGCHVPLPLFSRSERRARAAGDLTRRGMYSDDVVHRKGCIGGCDERLKRKGALRHPASFAASSWRCGGV